jgi:4a-hydroxytetrahydrobiopterin dehydratase
MESGEMSEDLASRHCAQCNAETPPIEGDHARRLLGEIDARWEIIDDHHLAARFKFDDFAGALAFANRVGQIAETETHHPEICVTWGKVKLRIWTYAIDGLSENDFILAAKIDQLQAG